MLKNKCVQYKVKEFYQEKNINLLINIAHIEKVKIVHRQEIVNYYCNEQILIQALCFAQQAVRR